MTVTGKKEHLCREWERFAAILSVLVRGERAGRSGLGRLDRRIFQSIIATEHQMIQISRELLSGLHLGDRKDVGDYVTALNASRLRTSRLGI